MTYEDKARILLRELGRGATLVDAIRAIDRTVAVPPDKADEIKRLRLEGKSMSAISRDTGTQIRHVEAVCSGAEPVRPLQEVIDDVIDAAACVFDTSVARVRGTSDEVAYGVANVARRAVALVLRERITPPLSYPKIARSLGRSDHTTAVNLVEKAKVDPEAVKGAEAIMARLASVDRSAA